MRPEIDGGPGLTLDVGKQLAAGGGGDIEYAAGLERQAAAGRDRARPRQIQRAIDLGGPGVGFSAGQRQRACALHGEEIDRASRHTPQGVDANAGACAFA